MEATDAALVERCAGGDEESLRELYRRYGRAVWSWCRRVLASGRLASDATERAFLQLWRMAGQRPVDVPVAAWMFELAQRAAGDRTPDPDLYAVWMGGQAASQLDALPPPQADALRLVGLEHRSVEEAAAILDADPADVRRDVFAGLGALADALESQRARR